MNLPPNLDDQILGYCLNTYGAIQQVALIIHKPETFTSLDNQQVYAVMLHLMKQSYHTDLVSVTNELTARHGNTNSLSMPWIGYVATLASAGQTFSGTLEYVCLELVKNAVQRSLVQEAGRMMRELSLPTTDPLLVLDSATRRLDEIRNRLHELKDTPFSDSYAKVVSQAEKAARSGNPITGLSTGIGKLDSYLKGLHPSTLTILAARPSMGKTAQLCQVTYNLAYNQQIPVVVFSLEMKCQQLAARYLAIHTAIKNAEVTSGLTKFGERVDIAKLWDAAGRLSNGPLFVYDQIFDIDHIIAKSKQLCHEHQVQAIFVDYLQLVETDERLDDRTRVSRVSRKLKKLSGTLDIPVVALSQLSREVEKREGRRPQTSDLRDSGSIEQDADNVVFLMRPAQYGLKDEYGEPIGERVLLNIIAKNRNGSTHSEDESIRLDYDRATNRIGDD